MDPYLLRKQPTVTKPFAPIRCGVLRFRSALREPRGRVWALTLMVCGALCFAGCQTQQFWQSPSELPIPPLVLDQDALESVRFQSPGGSGPRGGPGGGSDSRGPSPAPGGSAPKRPESDIVPDFQQLAESIDGLEPEIIKEVIITGNTSIPTHHLARSVRTRQGRYFDPDKLQQDVNMLWRMPEIKRVNGPFLDRQPDGIVVRIEVEERERLSSVRFIGNRGISDRELQKQAGLEDGSPLDVHEVRIAKTKIEDHYREKGYPRTQVEILETQEGGPNDVTFLIHEDQRQKIWKVNFEGNTIASEARLRHIVKSKPGIAKLFGGTAKRDEIEQDIQRLTTYYRGLGFFNAQIGREISESNDGRWLTVRFIINEGPRYKVREVRFIGNQAFTDQQLTSLVKMHPDKNAPDFTSVILNEDLREIRGLYGGQGFVFADINVENRFLEEPGLVDIVYRINEGKRYRVGEINVKYEGGNSVTKNSVVRRYVRLRPGDWIDMREIESSKASLARSQIFATGQGGAPPSIVVKPRELKDLESVAGQGSGTRTATSSSGSGSRTQSPAGSGSRSAGGSGYR